MSTGFSYSTAIENKAKRDQALLGDHNAEIVAQSAVLSSTGNPMINFRWKIVDEGDAFEAVVFDRLVISEGTLFRIEQFVKAIGRDPMEEFKDTALDLAFITHWAESLIGEMATLKIGLDKGTRDEDNPSEWKYAPKPEVKKYMPFGNAKSAASLIELD